MLLETLLQKGRSRIPTHQQFDILLDIFHKRFCLLQMNTVPNHNLDTLSVRHQQSRCQWSSLRKYLGPDWVGTFLEYREGNMVYQALFDVDLEHIFDRAMLHLLRFERCQGHTIYTLYFCRCLGIDQLGRQGTLSWHV